jgi:hypothetical protein
MSDYPGTKDSELVLRSSALQGAGSANGTGIAVGPTGSMPVKVCVIVSVVASGGTLDVSLQSSSDDAVADAYAAIAHSAMTQITAVGRYEQITTLPEKWVRIVGTVGVANVTWEAFITRV